MSKNSKQTSNKMAALAAKKLKDENASVICKKLASSILSQSNRER